MELLFGTNNLHKLKEVRNILAGHYHIHSLQDIGLDLEVEETADTLEGNAILKAETYARHSGLACFADDTGLEVEALGGAPGVYSARYAGPQCIAADNIQKLLGALAGMENRKARFRTVIAYVDSTQTLTFEGEVWGEIIMANRGVGGFGYDPVFLPDGFSHTFAEMKPEQKNQISHRGKAVQAFTDFLLA